MKLIKSNNFTIWLLWLALNFGLCIPVVLLASLIGFGNFKSLSLLCIIGLAWVIFDIGKLVILVPPSKAIEQNKG